MGPEPAMSAPIRSIALAMKAALGRAARRGQVPMHLVDVYRKDKRVMRVGCGEPEDVLDLLYNAPGACDADLLVVAADSWSSQSDTNPITGKRWEIGGMNEAAAKDMALERGIIKEQVMIVSFARDGATESAFIHYERLERGRIRWATSEAFNSDGDVGRFPEAARGGFDRPTMSELVIAEVGPPPPDYDIAVMIQRTTVSYALRLDPRYTVIESPKGPPLEAALWS